MNTSQAEVIKKCRHDMQKERIVKSVLWGLAAGFAVIFVLAFITWIFEFKGLWLSLGLGVAAWIGVALALYFVAFSFTDMDVMKRIDRTGLDERMITMYQLQGDTSYMAQRQREDAQAAFSAAVKKSGGQLIKTKIATAIICATSIACPLGAGMAVVTGLSDYDVIPTLHEMFTEDGVLGGHGSSTPTYKVTYMVGGETDGGAIMISNVEEGNTDFVQKGGSSSAKAVITQGYYIERWEKDGEEYYPNNVGYQPLRFSADNIQKNMTVTVVFAKYDDEADDGFYYYCDPDKKGGPDDKEHPKDFDDNNNENEQNPDNQPTPNPGNGAGGGSSIPGNTIIDNETQYSENYDEYHKIAMDILANGADGYPPELVAMLESYFGILLK